MARPEFPSIPIGAKRGQPRQTRTAHHLRTANQPWKGLIVEQGEALELGNCLVTSAVTFRKRVKGNEWRCSIHVEPDLLHPDQQGDYEAVAYCEYADNAHTYHLRPGDRAIMHGVLRQETTILAGGKEVTTNYVSVTDIELLSRSRRRNVTLFEQENGGDKKR